MIEAIRAKTREKLLADFEAFARRAWREIEHKELQWNWHHSLIAEYLMLATQKEELRLIFTMPPRGLKSRLISVLWPAWCWANDPSLSFISVSYADSLSEEHSVTRRKLMMSPWFQTMFPGKVSFAVDQNRREQYANLKSGMMIASSVKGALLGKGADYIIADDLLSPQQSFSDLDRNTANRFFDSTLRSRLNEPTKGGIVIVQQRLHEMDLVGHLLETEPETWKHINLPMVAVEEETIEFPISGRKVIRHPGDLLQANRFTQAWCEKTEKTVGRLVWASQYQQTPAPLEGNIIKASDVQFYGGKDPATGALDPSLPERFDRIVISVDASFKAKSDSDYVAIVVVGVSGARRYVLHIVNARLSLDQTENEIRHCYSLFDGISAVMIEDKGNGPAVVQHLRDEISGLVAVTPEGGKLARLIAASPEFVAGNWIFDRTATWTNKAVGQLTTFPTCKHDDIADAIAQASIWLQKNSHSYGLLEWAKQKLSGHVNPRILAVGKAYARREAEATPPSETVTRDQWEEWKRSSKAPNCTACGNAATVIDASGKTRCNQCSAVGGVLPAQNQTHCGCSSPLIVRIANSFHCNQCGWDSPRPTSEPTLAPTFKHLRRWPGDGFMLPGPRGWKTFGRF